MEGGSQAHKIITFSLEISSDSSNCTALFLVLFFYSTKLAVTSHSDV